MRSTDCVAHRHRSLVPVEAHHVRPISRGGHRKGRTVVICANAHGDVHYLLDLVEEHGGLNAVPAGLRRTFGPGVRRIALDGWAQYRDEFLSGDLDHLVRTMTSSGAPREPMGGATGE
jgi:hypothetical protein